jgi:hypothetical protein
MGKFNNYYKFVLNEQVQTPVAVVLMGTNDVGYKPGFVKQNTINTVNTLIKKGYRVAIIPPNSTYKQPYEEVQQAHSELVKNNPKNSVMLYGQIQGGGYSSKDPKHITPEAIRQIKQVFNPAVVVGDSNGKMLSTDTPYAKVGAHTDQIAKFAENVPPATNIEAPQQPTSAVTPLPAPSQTPSAALIQPPAPANASATPPASQQSSQQTSGPASDVQQKQALNDIYAIRDAINTNNMKGLQQLLAKYNVNALPQNITPPDLGNVPPGYLPGPNAPQVRRAQPIQAGLKNAPQIRKALPVQVRKALPVDQKAINREMAARGYQKLGPGGERYEADGSVRRKSKFGGALGSASNFLGDVGNTLKRKF